MKKVLLIGIVLMAAIFMLPGSANATVNVVYVKQNAPGPTHDGTSWATAYTDLQTALTNTSSGEVWVAYGDYFPTTGSDRTVSFQLKNNVGIYGGFYGNETSTTQRQPGMITYLNGDIGVKYDRNDNSYHVVNGSGTNSSAILDGFWIMNGNANGDGTDNYGGGIIISSGTPTLKNLNLLGNCATWSGAGIFNYQSAPTITNSTLQGNSAGTYGGGIANSFSNPVMENLTFHQNWAQYGGGIANESTNTPILMKNISFYGNTATASGFGLYSYDCTTNLQNCILWGNTDSAQIGNNANGSTTATYCDIKGGYSGEGNINENPLFGDFNIWGAFGRTLPLLPGSPAIDAGNSSLAPATDQRGFSRHNACDMGASEAQGFQMTIAGGNDQYAPVESDFANPVTINVSGDYENPVNGGIVTFTAPSNGASTYPPENQAIISSGSAIFQARANSIEGSYSVTAHASGAESVNFTLANTEASPAPDMEFVQPISIKGDASPRAKIKVSYNIINNGELPTGQPVELGFYLLTSESDNPNAENKLPGSKIISNLKVGKTKKGTASITLPDEDLRGKEYYLCAFIDDGCLVSETRERNNQSIIHFDMQYPDLCLQSAGCILKTGGKIEVNESIVNNGGYKSLKTTVKYSVWDGNAANQPIEIKSRPLSSLKPGITKNKKSTYKLPPGVSAGWYLIITIDPLYLNYEDGYSSNNEQKILIS